MQTETGGTISFPQGVVKIVTLRELQGCEAWTRAFHDKCKDHRYYEIVEQTLANNFEHHYLLLQDLSASTRAIQSIFFVQQNLVEGVPGKIRSLVDLVRKKFPRFLTMRVLMVGCAAGVGELDAVSIENEKWVADALQASLKTFARRKKASLIVLKDFPAKYRSALGNFSANGYARVPSMPMTRLSLHHRNFEEYLSKLSYATRKSLRRKFRRTERAPKIEMETPSDITPYLDEIYPLYLQVHERSRFKFETLTKNYFRRISQEMPERARFFIWRQLGKTIAFSFCLVCGDTIYDECLGLDYNIALDLHLYFFTMRDVISWAIKHGLGYYCSGPLNYDPKLHLGHELMPLDLYVMHARSLFNPIFRRAVKFLEPTRHDPILRRFPNSNDL
jgi:predicted N-acyltransferase